MNFRSKAIALISTVALGLTMTASIASAADTAATLANGSVTGCTSAISSGSNLDFGTYEWTGAAYVYKSGSSTAGNLKVTRESNNAPGVTCPAAQVLGTGLSLEGLSVTYAFTVGQIQLGTGSTINLSATDQALPGAGTITGPSASADTDVAVALTGSASTTAPVGNYSGTITVTQTGVNP